MPHEVSFRVSLEPSIAKPAFLKQISALQDEAWMNLDDTNIVWVNDCTPIRVSAPF
jgi:hypothetical protein